MSSDNKVRKWALDYIIDNAYVLEGQNLDSSEFSDAITERPNVDGCIFYNNYQAWDFICENRYEAGEQLRWHVDEWKSLAANPLDEPDAFCVLWLISLVGDIAYELKSVQELSSDKPVTEEQINKIVEECEQLKRKEN